MTNERNSSLIGCLDDVEQGYARVLADFRALAAEAQGSPWTSGMTMEISNRMDQIRLAGEQAAEIHASLSPEERQSTGARQQQERIADSIQELLQIVNQLETSARTAAAALVPQMRSEVKAMKMQQAYRS